ncbi:hypothetical protein HK100_008618, partial [Physocladia obscura]
MEKGHAERLQDLMQSRRREIDTILCTDRPKATNADSNVSNHSMKHISNRNTFISASTSTSSKLEILLRRQNQLRHQMAEQAAKVTAAKHLVEFLKRCITLHIRKRKINSLLETDYLKKIKLTASDPSDFADHGSDNTDS